MAKPSASAASTGPEARPGPGIASALKEQLALVTFIVLFGGLVATETYYAGFGIRYQVMELSVTHLVYRGLTAALDGPWLILAYLVAIGWLAGGGAWVAARGPGWSRWSQPITYALVIALIVLAYAAAIAAGAHAARLDLAERTSRLPTIREIRGKDGNALPFAGHRLLFAGKDSVILFKATDTDAETPFVHILRREGTSDITLSR